MELVQIDVIPKNGWDKPYKFSQAKLNAKENLKYSKGESNLRA